MKRTILYLFISFVLGYNSYAQAPSQYADLSFLRRDIGYPAITQETFSPIINNLVNEGMDNGTYWIKISLQVQEGPVYVELPYARLTDAEIYSQLGTGVLLDPTHYPSFKLSSPQEQEYYIKIHAYRPGYIPIVLKTEQDYRSETSSHLITNGLYYGFSICIILINLLFLLYFRDFAFLRYGIFVAVICINVVGEDGTFRFWDMPVHLFSCLDSFLHWLVPVSCVFFTWFYVDFRTHLPWLKWPLAITIIISGALFVGFHLTGSAWYSGWADTIGVIALLIVEVGAWMIFKKNVYAKIFTFADFFILICGLDLYVPKHFGLTFIGLGPEMLKMGGILEMIVFSIAVVYRMQKMRAENELHKTEIRRVLNQYDAISSRLQQAEESLSSATNSANQSNHTNDDIDYTSLTARQIEILKGIRRGLSNQEIADELFISLNTVKYHTKNIYEKLGIKRRTQLIANS